jgi:glycosyltransferase 2 family protein
MPRGQVLRAAIGATVSLVALFLVLQTIDLQKTADELRSADLRWIAFGWLLIVTDLALRGLRWQRLVRPIKSVPYLHMEAYLLIGYLMNNILPARLGELVRSHYLGDREGISRVSALGTVIVERIVDLVVCVTIASASLLILSVRGVVASAVLVGIGVTGLFLVVLAVGIAAHRLPGADRIARLIDRWPRIREAGRRVQDGLAVAGRPRTLVEALACSAGSWGASILAFAAIGQSIGLQLSIGQAALMTSGIALASAIPAGPSNLGTFELAAVLIGQAIGVPSEQAAAMALIAHVSIVLATSIGGGVALIRMGWQRSATDDLSVAGAEATDARESASHAGAPRETANVGGGPR